MSQRNGQNPVRMEKTFKKEHESYLGDAASRKLKASGVMRCPTCKADVPPKPGFRMSSLKCPKCGAAMHK